MLAEERISKGKTVSGIRYDAGFDEICSTLALVSPRAYATFRAEFGGRSPRSMR